jgi:hypothetical protein
VRREVGAATYKVDAIHSGILSMALDLSSQTFSNLCGRGYTRRKTGPWRALTDLWGFSSTEAYQSAGYDELTTACLSLFINKSALLSGPYE